ncbi:MAG: iron donor protein CyaY [Rickettsiales bacterium]|jgi:frataxin
MLEYDFQKLAEKTLDKLADALDLLDASGDLELDCLDGIITITLDSGKQFIINKHSPSQQIWLSSPVSGGLHFSYYVAEDAWKIADGRSLSEILMVELNSLTGIEVIL